MAGTKPGHDKGEGRQAIRKPDRNLSIAAALMPSYLLK
jgi:hypothetical protein